MPAPACPPNVCPRGRGSGILCAKYVHNGWVIFPDLRVTMIKVGDIVFRKYHGGIRNNQPDESVIGLVIREHGTDDPLSVNQYQVRFGLEETGKWYWQHDLFKVDYGRKK